MNAWIGPIAFVAGVALASAALFLLLRRTVDFRRLEQHNDVAGFIYAVVGVVYGVLLAFVVIVVWEHYADTERAVEHEAYAIAQIYRDSDAFPQPFENTLRTEIRRYAEAVARHEWSDLPNGRGSRRASAALDSLWRSYAGFVPRDANDRVWYAEILRRLNELVQDRQLRIAAASHRLPTVMWTVLLIGGAITIGFAYLFGTANTTAHVLMIAGLSLTLTLPIVLIWSLGHPFQGLGYVDVGPMRHALELLNGH